VRESIGAKTSQYIKGKKNSLKSVKSKKAEE
jgi:hypothetical protein